MDTIYPSNQPTQIPIKYRQVCSKTHLDLDILRHFELILRLVVDLKHCYLLFLFFNRFGSMAHLSTSLIIVSTNVIVSNYSALSTL